MQKSFYNEYQAGCDALPLYLHEPQRLARHQLFRFGERIGLPPILNPFSRTFVPNSERIGFRLDPNAEDDTPLWGGIVKAMLHISPVLEEIPEIVVATSIPRMVLTEYFSEPPTMEASIARIFLQRPGFEALRDFIAELESTPHASEAVMQDQQALVPVMIQHNKAITTIIAGEGEDALRYIMRDGADAPFIEENGQFYVQGRDIPSNRYEPTTAVKIPITAPRFYAAYNARFVEQQLQTSPLEDDELATSYVGPEWM